MGTKKKKSRRSARDKAKQRHQQNNGSSRSQKDRIETVEKITSRVSVFGSTLVHLGVIWSICAGLALLAHKSRAAHTTNNTILVDGYVIPQETLSSWTEYPNPLNITDEDRANFHPVVKFPQVWMDIPTGSDEEHDKRKTKRQKVDNYSILDHTKSSATTQLATEEERQLYKKNKLSRRQEPQTHYSVGRYDENRINLYQSDLFDDESNAIDGYSGVRTVHIGIDLDGPIGTKVHAFADGIVHSSGYNADLGDYGNVIVIEHDLGKDRKVWALYGHLDSKSISSKTKKGKKIKKGQVIGHFGDIHENGGW